MHGNASTYWGSLSGNGRRALFTVDDDDLAGNDGTLDGYVHNRKTGKTSLVTKSSDGTPVDTDYLVYPSIYHSCQQDALRCPRGGRAWLRAGRLVQRPLRGLRVVRG